MNLLVTGGAGFIGANFVEYWSEKYPHDRIVVLDLLTYAGNRNNLNKALQSPNVQFVQGNITDQALVALLLREHQLNTLVNFAAESHVDRSIAQPEIFVETNIVGTLSLLQAARQVWLEEPEARGEEPLPHRFHHVSTDEVFGDLGPHGIAADEQARYLPGNPYSATKAASDHLVRAWARTYGLNTSLSNCSNNFGPYQYPEKLMPRIITNILHERPLPVFGSGEQVRDWLYVADHAAGIDRIIRAGEAGSYYNIGGNNEQKNIDIIRLLCTLVDKAFAARPELKQRYPNALSAISGQSQNLIRFVADRPGHDVRYAINAGKIERHLGFHVNTGFTQALATTLDWYFDHPQWFPQ